MAAVELVISIHRSNMHQALLSTAAASNTSDQVMSLHLILAFTEETVALAVAQLASEIMATSYNGKLLKLAGICASVALACPQLQVYSSDTSTVTGRANSCACTACQTPLAKFCPERTVIAGFQ